MLSSTPDHSTIENFKKEKIKGAIRTDFILSAKIIIITLGVVGAEKLITQLGVQATVAILITIGVYGLVAGIVKLNDLDLHLFQKTNASAQKLGRGLLVFAPWLMPGLSVFSTLAMFMVGGGIITHDVAFFHHISQIIMDQLSHLFISSLSSLLFNIFIGLIFGGLVLTVVTFYNKLRSDS